MIWWILLALALAGAVLLLRRNAASGRQRSLPRAAAGTRARAAAAPARTKPPSEAIDNFRGTMLFPQKDCCAAIQKLRGQTFGQGRVPGLPVPGCDRTSCGCQAHPVVGRRRGPRRLTPDRRGDVRFKEDRRKGRDRRSGVDTWKARS